MNARPCRVAAFLMAALLLTTMATPMLAGSKKSAGVVVGSYQIVGEKVLVEVTNTSRATEDGTVSVVALVGGTAAAAAEAFVLPGGASAWISVGFLSQVDGVITLGISDDQTPAL